MCGAGTWVQHRKNGRSRGCAAVREVQRNHTHSANFQTFSTVVCHSKVKASVVIERSVQRQRLATWTTVRPILDLTRAKVTELEHVDKKLGRAPQKVGCFRDKHAID